MILGRELVHDKYFPMVNKDQPATEKIATDLILSQKRMGGLPPVEVPYVPEKGLMVTTLKNLSALLADRRSPPLPEGGYRRKPHRNYESSKTPTSSRTTASAAWSRTSKSRSR
ncbi:phage major capsid protein, P2 family [Pseudomonas aeruginosa]|nr:phage major capsid protein, P2 family [Pseudomonas aeruginosa]